MLKQHHWLELPPQGITYLSKEWVVADQVLVAHGGVPGSAARMGAAGALLAAGTVIATAIRRSNQH